jgi:hypothetical protein
VNIELHIERLIFDGLQVEQRNRAEVQAAIESELTRLLRTGGLSAELAAGGAIRSLGAGEIHMTNPLSAAHLGDQIAQAVHSGIGRESPPKP